MATQTNLRPQNKFESDKYSKWRVNEFVANLSEFYPATWVPEGAFETLLRKSEELHWHCNTKLFQDSIKESVLVNKLI